MNGFVPDGDASHRTATALRTALVGKPTVSFSAPTLVGPTPTPGRTIESVNSHGKHLEIVRDDERVRIVGDGFEIEFSDLVDGPILLGSGSHYGLGAFEAME